MSGVETRVFGGVGIWSMGRGRRGKKRREAQRVVEEKTTRGGVQDEGGEGERLAVAVGGQAGREEGRRTRNEEILSTFPTLHAASYPLRVSRSLSLLSLSRSLHARRNLLVLRLLLFSCFCLRGSSSAAALRSFNHRQATLPPSAPLIL